MEVNNKKTRKVSETAFLFPSSLGANIIVHESDLLSRALAIRSLTIEY